MLLSVSALALALALVLLLVLVLLFVVIWAEADAARTLLADFIAASMTSSISACIQSGISLARLTINVKWVVSDTMLHTSIFSFFLGTKF